MGAPARFKGGFHLYLEKITSPADIKGYGPAERKALAQEMRDAMLRRASIHGGHFGPDFGAVEAIIALHTVFDSPRDKIVYDISHQSYPHKMLTGRVEAYIDEAHYDAVSGYTNPEESPHDFFNVGHTSTSISLASGLAKARDLAGRKENIIAFIGDGSMSGGEALEGLNVAGEMATNFIIVFNDNDQSIAENHGGMYREFRRLRETGGTAPNNLFRAMGLDYRYVARGNDAEALIAAFEAVKDSQKPVVVHIHTQKGKGYKFAEEDRETWHYRMAFDIETGELKHPYTDPFQETTKVLNEAAINAKVGEPELCLSRGGHDGRHRSLPRRPCGARQPVRRCRHCRGARRRDGIGARTRRCASGVRHVQHLLPAHLRSDGAGCRGES